MPITSVSQLNPNGTYTYADYLTWQFTGLIELLRGKIMRRVSAPGEQTISAFVCDAGTSRYQLVGEYASFGPVPCATLPGLALDWGTIFPEPIK